MMLTTLLLLAAQGPIQVDGLHEGERFHALVSSPAVDISLERFGRVVDAYTGFPVAGARVEAWTEEMSELGQGYHLVGHAETRADGMFRVEIREGEMIAEKVRVRAPGYLAFPGTVGDLGLVLLHPQPKWTTRVRVVDLLDQPIENARITSTYSCAHDIPSFDVRTDADGIAELPEYGLQDQTGELRVRAAGYAAQKYIDWSEVAADTQTGEPALIRLPKQRSMRARALTYDGTALSNQALYAMDGDGYHVPMTDLMGNFEIESSYSVETGGIRVLSKTGEQSWYLFFGRLPADGEATLRVSGNEWPADTEQARVFANLPESGSVPFQFFHESGWWQEGLSAEGTLLPAGNVRANVGGAFSGWEEASLELELAKGEVRQFELDLKPEPELTILAPEDAHLIIVQAGDQSLDVNRREELTVSVPANQPLIVYTVGERNRRLLLDPIESDAVADLRPESCLLPLTRAQANETAAQEVLLVRIGDGLGGTLSVDGAVEGESKRLAPKEFMQHVRVGRPVLIGYHVDGFADCWLSAAGESAELTVTPTRLAKLSLENQTGLAFATESVEAKELGRLNPGPFSLQIRFEDGRRVSLSLELEPGEERTLTLSN